MISIVNTLELSIEKTSDFSQLDVLCPLEEIGRFKAIVDKNLESIKNTSYYESLKVEGEKVKKWLETYSICDATELVILARNNKNN